MEISAWPGAFQCVRLWPGRQCLGHGRTIMRLSVGSELFQVGPSVLSVNVRGQASGWMGPAQRLFSSASLSAAVRGRMPGW